MIDVNPRVRVLVVTDSGPTATQEISFSKPFAAAHTDAEFEFAFAKNYSDASEISAAFEAHKPALLVLSRFTASTGACWIARSRDDGIPVIFHIDDDLLAVPTSLGEAKHRRYNEPARLQALRDNVELSDVCYVSTKELAKRFAQHGISTPIVAGDIYRSVALEEIGALVDLASGPVVGYMGTSGHAADLAMIVPAICEAMERVSTLNFELFGTIKTPPELGRFGSRVRHLPPIGDYGKFISYLRSVGWWIGLAPLEDNCFNRCKADTKWVEYSLAGMAVIASDLPVYRRGCANGAGILASSLGDWTDGIVKILERPHERERMVENAQERLRADYTHQRLREQVGGVFRRAFHERKEPVRSRS